MAINGGEVLLSVRADTDKAKRDIQNLDKELSSSTNSLSKQLGGLTKKFAGAFGLALGAKALVDFGKSCISLGSDLAEVQNVVDVVFPHMNDAVNEWAENASAKFGLSETMAKRYVGTFGSMAEAFGFTEQKALEMGETLTGLAGDVASFYNISQDEAYTKLKSVFSGETETLKELGIVMTQSALDQYALANGIGKTTSAMSEAEKVSLRYQFVQDQLTNATGDFARTSGSWANQVRLLSLQFDSLRASIGQGLISVLTPVIRGLNILMAKLVQAARMFQSFLALFGIKAQAPMGATAKATNQLSSGLGNVGKSGGKASKGLGKANKSAKQLQRTLAGFDQITKLDKTDTSAGGGGGGGGAGGGGIGGGDFDFGDTGFGAGTPKIASDLLNKYPALAKSIQNLHRATKPFIALMKSAGKWVLENVLKPLGKWIVEKFAPAYINKLASKIRMITKVLKALSPILKLVWEVLKPVIKLLGDEIIKSMERSKSGIEAIGKMFDSLAPYIKTACDLLNGQWQDALENVGNIKDFAIDVQTKFSDTKESLANKFNQLISGVGSFFVSVGTVLADTAQTLKNKVSAVVSGAGSFAKDIALTVSTSAGNVASAINNKLKGIKTKTVSIKLKFTAAVSDLKAWINSNVIGKINAKFRNVPILRNNLIPRLAEGGYVKANTPQLAMIGDNRHQGEVVSPESKLNEMAMQVARSVGGNSNQEVVVLLQQVVTLLAGLNLTATVSGNDLTNMVVRLINQKTKATGQSPLYI